MKPFTRFESLNPVLAWLDQQAGLSPSEPVDLPEAGGRVLSGEVAAPLDFPPFDRAAVDGYAVCGLATVGAGGYGPVTFMVNGEVATGCATPGALLPGTALRIAAGAPLPSGADAVVPRSFAEETAGQVDLLTAVAPGENVVRRGTDIARGSRLVPAGHRLRPGDLAVLAACGIERVNVVRKPRVHILIAGQGLAPVTGIAARGPHEICEADSLMLTSLVVRDGGKIESCRRIPADRSMLAEILRNPCADLALVVGGSGEGWRDCAAEALSDVGELAFHGIALEPARSAGVGRVGDTLVFLLPGDPVACLCAYDCLAGPTLRRMAGLKAIRPYPERRVVLLRKITSNLGGVEYCRVRLTPDGAEPLASGANTSLAALAAADGYLLVPEDSEGYPAGAEISLLLYDSFE